MTEPYLFERAIGRQMGDLCRLAVGDAKVTQTGDLVTLEDMLGRGVFGVSVEVPYINRVIPAISVTRSGKNIFSINNPIRVWPNKSVIDMYPAQVIDGAYYWGEVYALRYGAGIPIRVAAMRSYSFRAEFVDGVGLSVGGVQLLGLIYFKGYNPLTGVAYGGGDQTIESIAYASKYPESVTVKNRTLKSDFSTVLLLTNPPSSYAVGAKIQVELGSTATDYEPYNGDTYTITLPADFYGGTVNIEAGTVTSRYAADGTELPEPVVTEIDHIGIPILAGVNNIWANAGTVTVSYYPADKQGYRPALWYPTIYRGLTSARYLIKRASGAIANFSDAIAAPLVGLRVALPYDAEGYQSVSVTRCGKNLLNWELPTNQFTGLTFLLSKNGKFVLRTSGVLSGPAIAGTAFIRYVLNGTQSYSSWGDASSPYRLTFNGLLQYIEIINWGSISGTLTESQLELGSTATDYEPYNGDTYTITLPTTIYGGYLDVVTGQLVATHDENGNLLANQKLYFLPPTNINALAGVNNVWSDAGDVAVSYRIDNG